MKLLKTAAEACAAGPIANWLATGIPVLLLWLVPTWAQAQFNYLTNKGTITITDYWGPGGSIAIPTMITGVPVTEIKSRAFYGCHTVTCVTIPATVTNIGIQWPGGKTGSCIFPETVTSIGERAFAFCMGVTSITVPATLNNIGDWAFYYANT